MVKPITVISCSLLVTAEQAPQEEMEPMRECAVEFLVEGPTGAEPGEGTGK